MPTLIGRFGSMRFRSTAARNGIAYTPDGKQMITASNDKLYWWNVISGELLRVVSAEHHNAIRVLAVSPDGAFLATDGATGETKGDLRVWDAKTGQLIRSLSAAEGRPEYLRFSADGRFLVAVHVDAVGVFETSSWGARIWKKRESIEQAALSPRDEELVVVDSVGNLEVWEIKTGKRTVSWSLTASRKDFECSGIIWSKDARHLIVGSKQGTIEVWSVAGKRLGGWKAHAGPVYDLCLSRDGSAFFSTTSATSGTRLACWALESHRCLWEHSQPLGGLGALTVSPDGKTVAASSRVVRFWDAATGKEREPPTGHLDMITALAYSPQGNRIVSGDRDGLVCLWETKGGLPVEMVGHKDEVQAVAWSPDGKLLASAGIGVSLWDPAGGKRLPAPELAQLGAFYSLAFSPNGRFLAAGRGRGGVSLIDVASRKEVRRLDQQHPVFAVAFSADTRVLAAAGMAQTFSLWDVGSGKRLYFGQKEINPGGLPLMPDPTFSTRSAGLEFRPDGRALMTYWPDLGHQGWDILSRKYYLSPKVGTVVPSSPFRFAWSSGLLVYGGAAFGRSAGLADAFTLQELRTIEADEGTFGTLAFSSDGRTLAAGGWDGSITFWDLTGRSRKPMPAPRLDEKELARLSSLLDSQDAAEAYRATWALVDNPAPAVRLLGQQMRTDANAVADKAAALLVNLDSRKSRERDDAEHALEKMGSEAEAALRHAAESGPSAEVRSRATQLLDKLDAGLSKQQIRRRRALIVLEQVATPEAIALLRELAKTPASPYRPEAELSLERLKQRGLKID